jgi:hypothetical protein
MESKFLKDALLNGMTSNAFKLGTVMSLGWFWFRTSGCSLLYRGLNMAAINFDQILTVADIDASHISPPSYLSHSNGTAYFYVVRKANGCGGVEQTLAAAFIAEIDSNGDLMHPKPNNIFKLGAGQIEGNKIQLTWYYSPLAQGSVPSGFNIYFDAGSGEIDYETAIASVTYQGCRFYSFESDTLSEGKYLFGIRAEDSSETENLSFAQISVELNQPIPAPIDFLQISAI